jgi:hypothetical protein
VQLVATYLAALAAYFLALRFVPNRGGAVFAGLIFTLTTFRFVHLPDHLNLIHTGFLPLSGLLVLRLADAPSLGRGAALGAAIGAAFLTDPQVAIYSLVVVLVLGLARGRDLRPAARPLAAAAAVAALVSLPLALPMASAVVAGEAEAVRVEDESAIYSANPRSWFLPPEHHLVLGSLGARVDAAASYEGLAYPGLVALVLAHAGWKAARPRRRRWLILALVGVVLSLGPYLPIGNTGIRIPLPFALLEVVPGLDIIRVPGRFAIVGMLGIAVLAGAGAARVLAKVRDARATLLLATALAVVVVVDVVPRSLPQRDDTVPEPYRAIADHHGEGAVLDLPLQWGTGTGLVGGGGHGYQAIQMVYATVHGRPLVNGSVSRLSIERRRELLDLPAYRAVLILQRPEDPDDAAADAADVVLTVDDLRAAGVGYIVYHDDLPVPAVREAVEELDLPVLADDGSVRVWVVPDG